MVLPVLNVLDARIDIVNNKINCNYKGIQHNINMNESEDHYKVSETPIVLSKPKVQYVPTQYTSRCV